MAHGLQSLRTGGTDDVAATAAGLYRLAKWGHAGVMDGTAGEYLSSGTIPNLNTCTTNLVLMACVRATDWTPATSRYIHGWGVGSGATSASQSATMYVNTSGFVGFQLIEAGGTARFAASSAAPVIADGGTLWVALYFDPTTELTNFYTSTNGPRDHPGYNVASGDWTLLGSAGRAFTVAWDNTFASRTTAAISANHTQAWDGQVFYVAGAINGTPVYEHDFSDPAYAALATSTVDARGVAWTATGTGGIRKVIGTITTRIRVAMDDWTPAASQVLFSQFTAFVGVGSYRIHVTTAGRVVLTRLHSGGSVNTVFTSSVSPTVTNLAPLWLEVVSNALTGRVDFATSASETPDHRAAAFTALGVQQVGVGGVLVGPSNSESWELNVGAQGYSGGGWTLATVGNFYAAAVMDEFGTDIVNVDFTNPDQFEVGTAPGVDADGVTWTPTNGAAIVSAGTAVGAVGVSLLSSLDLADRSRRVERFSWSVINAEGGHEGEINPEVGASLTMSTSGVGRTIRGVRILAADMADLEPATVRLQPSYTDNLGTVWPLGVYRVANVDTDLTRDHAVYDLADESLRFQSTINRRMSWPRGYLAVEAIEEWAVALSIYDYDIDSTVEVLGHAVAFPVGEATWGEVGDALFRAAGMLPPHFNNAGVLRARLSPSWDTVLPDHIYSLADGDRIIWGGYTESLAFLDTPNVWYAVNENPGHTTIRGRWPLPGTAPNSVAAIGYEVPEYISGPYASGAVARQAAETAGRTVFDQMGEAGLDTPLDPRHDLYALVDIDGVRWREVQWSVSLAAGSVQSHDLRRIW